MSLPEKNNLLLSLETDLPVGPGDSQATPSPNSEQNSDLAGYLAFLEEIGAFQTKKTGVKIYSEVFQLKTHSP